MALQPHHHHHHLYGDVLEAVVARVPTLDLLPASRVSPDWRSAVLASLRRHPRLTPWLLLRHLRHPLFSLHAFDPFSRSWLRLSLPPPSSPHLAPHFLCASRGDRLHTLSLAHIAVSADPFAATWRPQAKAPKIWRQDAVVAEVGRWLVVAGGACPLVLDEGEQVGAVEVYDSQTGTWESAEPMPAQFDGSASATWLSVAASDERLYVMEKKTGLAAWFDPSSKRWGPARQVRPDAAVSAWAIAIGRRQTLAVVGAGPAAQAGMSVRLWEVDPDTMRAVRAEAEEMPAEAVGRLFPSEEEEAAWRSCSVEVCGTEHGGYVYNPGEMRKGAVLYEFGKEEREVGRWEWVPLPERVGEDTVGGIQFGCSAVGLDEVAFYCRKRR